MLSRDEALDNAGLDAVWQACTTTRHGCACFSWQVMKCKSDCPAAALRALTKLRHAEEACAKAAAPTSAGMSVRTHIIMHVCCLAYLDG